MISQLKSYGLALLAVLVIGGATAGSAFAETSVFLSEAEETTLSGMQEEESVDVITTAVGTVECEEVTYSGTQVGFEAEEIDLEPAYGECSASSNEVSVEENGCKYRLAPETFEGAPIKATVDIVCPTGKELTFKILVLGLPVCVISVPSQNGLGTVTLTEVDTGAESDVTADVEIENEIKYSHKPGSGFGCSTGSGEDGDYTGTATISGSAGESALSFRATTTPKHGSVDPSPVVIVNNPNGDRTGRIYFRTAGKYKVEEQFLKFGTKFKLDAKSTDGKCGSEFFTVKSGEIKPCQFTVTGINVAPGESDTLITKWRPEGGNVIVNETTVRR